jgi:hypothetical protein
MPALSHISTSYKCTSNHSFLSIPIHPIHTPRYLISAHAKCKMPNQANNAKAKPVRKNPMEIKMMRYEEGS